jgi:hypothetical protein
MTYIPIPEWLKDKQIKLIGPDMTVHIINNRRWWRRVIDWLRNRHCVRGSIECRSDATQEGNVEGWR